MFQVVTAQCAIGYVARQMCHRFYVGTAHCTVSSVSSFHGAVCHRLHVATANVSSVLYCQASVLSVSCCHGPVCPKFPAAMVQCVLSFMLLWCSVS